MLIINDSRIIKNSYIQAFEWSDIADNYTYNELIPLSYKFSTVENESALSALQITAKNISGHDIPEFREDLYPLYIYKEGGWGSEPNSRTTRHRFKINDNQIFEITDANMITLKDVKIIFVISRVGTFDIF